MSQSLWVSRQPTPGHKRQPQTRNSSDHPSLPRMEPRLVKLPTYRPTADCEISQIYVTTGSKVGFGTRIVTIPHPALMIRHALRSCPTSPPRTTNFPYILLKRCLMPRKAVDGDGAVGQPTAPLPHHISRARILRDVSQRPTSQRQERQLIGRRSEKLLRFFADELDLLICLV